jgi:hypothetical protein
MVHVQVQKPPIPATDIAIAVAVPAKKNNRRENKEFLGAGGWVDISG